MIRGAPFQAWLTPSQSTGLSHEQAPPPSPPSYSLIASVLSVLSSLCMEWMSRYFLSQGRGKKVLVAFYALDAWQDLLGRRATGFSGPHFVIYKYRVWPK